MKKMRILGKVAAATVVAALCGMSATAVWATQTAQTTAANESEAAPVIQAKVVLESCLITADKNTIQIHGKRSGDMIGTDGNFYLFELQPYQNKIGDRTDFLLALPGGQDINCAVDLNRNTETDRLYSGFVIAVYDGTKFVEVSDPHYVNNPEILAKNTEAFPRHLTKKGLRIEIDMLSDAFELGVKHVGTDIAFHQILGSGIEYVYDGKTYHFSKEVIEKYDKTISALSNKDMIVTAVILNGWNDAAPGLIRPGTQKNANAFYYMFNIATKEGLEQTRAIASFLAERYDGSDPNHGKISNWVIGNEINNQQWNYMGEAPLNTYVEECVKAFRVFYTAIKSVSSNDRVYFSIDNNWNQDMDGKLKYGGKELLDAFNSLVRTQGQMDWGLAYHPYPYPMVEPEFWDDNQAGLTKDINTPVLNFYNLDLLTDYLGQSEFRSPSGDVRHVILTEQGFTSKSHTRGDVPQIQAAAYAYSYYMVDSNPYIDAYILSRQVDAPSEVESGVAFGLWGCDMNQPNKIVARGRKKLWQVFKNIDKKDQTLENTEFAKEIIGIQKWSDIIPNFRWKNLEQ